MNRLDDGLGYVHLLLLRAGHVSLLWDTRKEGVDWTFKHITTKRNEKRDVFVVMIATMADSPFDHRASSESAYCRDGYCTKHHGLTGHHYQSVA